MKNLKISKQIIIIIVIILFSNHLEAQKFANNWVIRSFGLEFKNDTVLTNKNYGTHLYKGIGIHSDINGSLLFYTDGNSVWNRNHELMLNGTQLIVSNASSYHLQSIIIPLPGSSNLFYIITTAPYISSTISGLYYSIVDLNLDNGLGGVIQKGILISKTASMKFTAVYHNNHKDVWLISHQDKSNNYYSFLISESGISKTPVVNTLGPIVTSNFEGQIKASPDGKRIAYSFGTFSGDNGFDLFDFNDSTGELSNPLNFRLPAVSRACDGIEFSSDAKKLYVYQTGSTGEDGLYQFDLSHSNFELINNSRVKVLSPWLNGLQKMQLAPNGKIYITKGGGQVSGLEYLGVINAPNLYGLNSNVIEKGLYIQGSNAEHYTPSFIQNYFFKTDFKIDNLCQAGKTRFQITNESRLDSVKWSFGEGSTSKLLNPEFNYNLAGDYLVQLIAYYPEKSDTIIKLTTINPYTEFDLGKDTTVCFGYKLDVSHKFNSYQWNTQDTTKVIKIEKDGLYKLIAKNNFGCLYSDSVYLNVIALPEINLSDTLVIGDVSSIEINPGEFHSYLWSTEETMPIITVSKEGWYSVEVKDESGCQSAKSVYVSKDGLAHFQENPEWIRLNPIPSGYPGRDINFINDEIGFIVNDHEIIRTLNSGKTWEVSMKISSGNRIAFKNSVGYIIGNNGSIYKSTQLGEGWNKINVNFSDNLNAISLIDKNTLVLTSDDKLFITKDDGKSWEILRVNGVDIEDSYFINTKIGSVACKNGTILKTIDGGENWYKTLSTNTFPSDFFRITFVNKNIGFASREYGSLYRTTDCGETWTVISEYSDAAYTIQFINESIGFKAGEYGSIYKTLDGGLTWQWIGFNGRTDASDLYSIFFIDENIGFATGMRGRIIKTINGGKTWSEYAPTYNAVSQLQFTSKDTGYARVGNAFFKTYNKGKDWINIGAPLPNIYTGQFDFINDQIGYAIVGGSVGTSGNSGSVFKTIDGGTKWTKAHDVSQLITENLICIDFIDKNAGFVSGGYNQNKVLKTTDGGKTWKQVLSQRFGQIQFLNTNVGYARTTGYYSNSIYKTIDGGETWQIVFTIDDDITSLHFINDSIGYFVGDNAIMYKTINAGTTWQKLTVPYKYYIFVKFYSSTLGYILDDYGYLYKTKDGGINWEQSYLEYGIGFIGMHDLDVFISGNYGSILKSTLYKDLIQLGNLSASGITDSSATIQSSIKSELALENTKLFLVIGRQSGVYEKCLPIEAINGTANQSIKYELKDLIASTNYYCRLKIVNGENTIFSSEFRFKTSDIRTLINVVNKADETIKIYPNPTEKFIVIECDEDFESSTYEIIDIHGRLLQKGKINNGQNIDFSTFNNGIYILNILVGNERFTKRVMKQ